MFKTLVTIANTKEYLVFVIPVAQELDLKKCAKAANVKAVEMIHVKDINKDVYKRQSHNSSTIFLVLQKIIHRSGS